MLCIYDVKPETYPVEHEILPDSWEAGGMGASSRHYLYPIRFYASGILKVHWISL